MKKALKRRLGRGQKDLQLYACDSCNCSCRNCGSTPANDSEYAYTAVFNNDKKNQKS